VHRLTPGIRANPQFRAADAPSRGLFPDTNWLKIEFSKSSVVVFPTTSPTAFTATCKSNGDQIERQIRPYRLQRHAGTPSRARRSASWWRELIITCNISDLISARPHSA